MMQDLKISEKEINFELQNEVSVGYLTGTYNYFWNKENYPVTARTPSETREYSRLALDGLILLIGMRSVFIGSRYRSFKYCIN
jgi:hypothetical protein